MKSQLEINPSFEINETSIAVVPIGIYINKLVKTWHKHGRIVILVDYDDTLVGHSYINKETCNKVGHEISKAQKLGADVILWTCRLKEEISEQIKNIEEEFDFIFTDVNPTKPFREGYSHKPYCNISLDDKAGLEQSLAILKQATVIYGRELTIKANGSIEEDRECDV